MGFDCYLDIEFKSTPDSSVSQDCLCLPSDEV